MDDLLHSLCNVCVGLFFSSNFCIFFVNMSSKWESHAYLFYVVFFIKHSYFWGQCVLNVNCFNK